MTKSIVPNALFQPPSKRNIAPAEPSGPTYEIVVVTPELAEKWLTQNTHNRNVREARVLGYARDMEAGGWAENGEAIKFAKDGTLLDGQHRLLAVTVARVAVRMLVATGLERRAQETMDDGAKRSLADVLHLRGEKHPVVLAATAKRALLWTHGYTTFKATNPPTNTECLSFLDVHPELRDSAEVGSLLRVEARTTSAVLGFTHWLLAGIDAEDAAWFFEHLASGADLAQYHPVWSLRKKYADEQKERARLPEEHAIALLIKAWNAFRRGEQVQVLRYTPGGKAQEKFPMPK